MEIFQNVLISIKKHDANIISTEELYYECMSLIAICSMKLKTVILNVDINQTNELAKVKEEIRKEFNCVCILPLIFILEVNSITILIFSIILLFFFPNSIRKEE